MVWLFSGFSVSSTLTLHQLTLVANPLEAVLFASANFSGNRPVPAEASFLFRGKYLLDNHRVFNAGDHVDGAAAFPARFDVNIEWLSS
jgi:hypothetical protein